MGWQREYEYWRDMGHTWGPGIDDKNELSEEEQAEEEKRYEAYLKKKEEYTVAPRNEFLEAGKEIQKTLPSHHDIIFGNAPLKWREDYSSQAMELCKKAAESLGYTFALAEGCIKKENHFAIGVDSYGWLPDRGGNIHKFIAYDITNLEDCLQLVADFAAIGREATTYFDNGFHYTTKNTGDLRIELERWSKSWNILLPLKSVNRKPDFNDIISDATYKKNHRHEKTDIKKDAQKDKKSKGER